MKNYKNKFPDSKFSESDLISSIQEGNEYVLSTLEGVIEGKYSDIKILQKYLDEKVRYGHINRREENGEFIYYPSTEEEKEAILSIRRTTKDITNNFLFNSRLFDPNENKSS